MECERRQSFDYNLDAGKNTRNSTLFGRLCIGCQFILQDDVKPFTLNQRGDLSVTGSRPA